MKRNSYSSLAFAAVVALGLVASSLAIAADGINCLPPVNTPSANSAVMMPRVWNDCAASTLTLVNNYPALVSISDTDVECFGYTNLNVWALSEDGITPAVFENCSHYQFSCVFNGSGSQVGPGGAGEGGLRLSPWWSLQADGRFNVRIGGNGEIACFGGRLPFYSFTGAYGVAYTPGTDIWLSIIYAPHALTVADPATIEYKIYYQGNTYTSGFMPFDQGNPGEGHGEYGALFPAQVGGYLQAPNQPQPRDGRLWSYSAQWKNIHYVGPSATPASQKTWGQLKTMYR
jgi:hypothetical protein